MDHRQHEEARRKRQIADVQAQAKRLNLPQDDALFATWYVDEGRKDSVESAHLTYRTPVDGVSPKGRMERQERIEEVTRRAHMHMITDPWAKNFATWYVDEERDEPLLKAWDEWRAERFTRSAS